MNTTITREELFEKFVTKEYLHDELDKAVRRIALDLRSVIVDVANMLNGKIVNQESRIEDHITQNALDHSDLRRAIQ